MKCGMGSAECGLGRRNGRDCEAEGRGEGLRGDAVKAFCNPAKLGCAAKTGFLSGVSGLVVCGNEPESGHALVFQQPERWRFANYLLEKVFQRAKGHAAMSRQPVRIDVPVLAEERPVRLRESR